MTHLNLPYNDPNTSKLQTLVKEFNGIPEDNEIQRLYQLQKINQYLNELELNKILFQWRNEKSTTTGSWESLLHVYDINPDASFFLKSIQFANAIAEKTQNPQLVAETDLYKLMQERDTLLSTGNLTEEQIKRFAELCCQMKHIAETEQLHRDTIANLVEILKRVQMKISNIKGHIDDNSGEYYTEPLGKGNNNYNFILHLKDSPEKLVVRVEDREVLSIEQRLQSHPVSRYFGNDIAVFMMEMKDDSNKVVYKPMVISHYANQGDLLAVAKSLKNKRVEEVAGAAIHYSTQINDFCIKLMQAGFYHPDLKAANILSHNGVVRICDRKTFIDQSNPIANTVRSSPRYAPPEYLKCLNKTGNAFNSKARKTHLNMPQFMAYQVGMLLKEFLLKTQVDKLPDSYWDQNCQLNKYFSKRSRAITNLDLIIRELTEEDPSKRLSIEQFQFLLKFISQPHKAFCKEVEKILPVEDEEIKKINDLLNNFVTSQ
jgi:serine/threonine protein kinase